MASTAKGNVIGACESNRRNDDATAALFVAIDDADDVAISMPNNNRGSVGVASNTYECY